MSLTEREIEILDTIVEFNTIKESATKLRVSPSTIYNILYRLRNKNQKWRRNINILLGYRKKSKILDRSLAPKVTIRETEKEVEEEFE